MSEFWDFVTRLFLTKEGWIFLLILGIIGYFTMRVFVIGG